jgi:hypothetical protein
MNRGSLVRTCSAPLAVIDREHRGCQEKKQKHSDEKRIGEKLNQIMSELNLSIYGDYHVGWRWDEFPLSVGSVSAVTPSATI